MDIKRGDVVLINLDPTIGKEIRKTRPCLIISPNELNIYLHTFIVAPMTTGGHAYPFRISCRFQGKNGYIILDQIRTIDKDRIVKVLGTIPSSALSNSLHVLQDMFT